MHNVSKFFPRRRRRKPKCPRIKAHWADYCASTSVHGLKYLTEPNRPWPERLLWLVNISLALGVCLTFIHMTWERWQASPVIVAMDENQRPVWDVPFPAVTICPQSKVRKTKFNYLDVSRMIRTKGANITDKDKEILYDLSLQCNAVEGPRNANDTRRWNNLAIERIEKYSMPLKRVVEFISFRQAHLLTTAFQPILTDEGLCYSFNMLPAYQIFPNNTFHASRKYLQYSQSPSWSLDGYEKGSGQDAYPFRALLSGQPMGLLVPLMTFGSDFDVSCRKMEEGYKVQLHNPAQFPQPGHQSLSVPLNSKIQVTVSPYEIITDRDMKSSYSVEQRKCYFTEERRLRFFLQYTQQNCELECVTNLTLRRCGCVAFFMPRGMKTAICGSKEQRCVFNSQKMFQILESGLIVKGNSTEPKGYTKCNCLQSCNHIRYDHDNSYSELDIELYRKLYKQPTGENQPFISFLSIYFKESSFIPTRRMELYGNLAFLANCGGLLGLCLGVSVLSMVECLYWALVRPFCRPLQRTADNGRCEG